MSPDEHDVMRSVEDQYWWYVALRRHVAESIDPRGAEIAILDAGCGSGGMLQVLRKTFPAARLTGLDASEYAIGLTNAREIGADLVVGSVEQLPFGDAQFDCVLSIDVLTAAGVNPRAALSEAHRVLRAGGQFIVNVAAFNFLRGAHDIAVDVNRRYTRAEVRASLTQAGFDIEQISYWNTLVLPPIAVLRWISRMRAKPDRARSDFRPLPGLLNVTLHDIALLELRTGARVSLPFGTSIFAVARKNA
ncbi:MAG: class I SAM-dependent methyltransferase [Verrucomicrobiota bacterium]|nr:class I SAM-dependent methyltransferase [Verrucomicrobiota bacterium]